MKNKIIKLGCVCLFSVTLLFQVNSKLFAQKLGNSGLEYDVFQYIQETKKYVVNVISGNNYPENRQVTGKAITGFIVDVRGIVITRKSVIEDMNYVYVKLNNGKEIDATLIGIDNFYDFAILRTEPFNIEPPGFAHLNSEKIGNTILIQANTLGYYPDHSFGLVENVLDHGVLQIVGALWPGHSGAPVFNFKGQVVGILSVLLASDNDKPFREIRVEKEGIVIPIVHLFPSIKQIIDQASLGNPWLGLMLTEYKGKNVKFSVTHIAPKSPSEKAGLKLGDEILSFDGETMNAYKRLKEKIQSMRPLDSIRFVIKRRDSTFTKNVRLGKMPSFYTSVQPEFELQPQEKQESIFDKYPQNQVDRLLLEKRIIQIEGQLNAIKRMLKKDDP